MAKGGKGVKGVKGDYVSLRVLIPKSTHRALKAKCALSGITVQRHIVDIVHKSVKGVEKDIVSIKAKV